MAKILTFPARWRGLPIDGWVDPAEALGLKEDSSMFVTVCGGFRRAATTPVQAAARIRVSDKVVLELNAQPHDGDVVAALIGGQVLLKRLQIRDGRTRLIYDGATIEVDPDTIKAVATCGIYPLRKGGAR